MGKMRKRPHTSQQGHSATCTKSPFNLVCTSACHRSRARTGRAIAAPSRSQRRYERARNDEPDIIGAVACRERRDERARNDKSDIIGAAACRERPVCFQRPRLSRRLHRWPVWWEDDRACGGVRTPAQPRGESVRGT